VRQVGYLQRLYRDARSTERKRFVISGIYILFPPTFLFLLISHHLLTSLPFVASVRWLFVLL